jgi:hypothetical protein
MTFPRSTVVRVVVAVLAAWLLIGLIALVLFHGGGSAPGDGRGDRMDRSADRMAGLGSPR